MEISSTNQAQAATTTVPSAPRVTQESQPLQTTTPTSSSEPVQISQEARSLLEAEQRNNANTIESQSSGSQAEKPR